MKESSRTNLHLALVHYPVLNKSGDTIASAVTNLDIHDIARAAKTYGARSFTMVTPLTDQIELVRQIVAHWTSGHGAAYNPQRRKALALVNVAEELQQVVDSLRQGDRTPQVVATSAKSAHNAIGYSQLRQIIRDGSPVLLVFGTGWGLAPPVIDTADHMLAPIRAKADYNHLSVRSAAAIILDRLMGTQQ